MRQAPATGSPASGPPLISWPILDGTGVDAYLTTREGGVSAGPYESLNLGLHVGDDPAAVLENRRQVAEAIGASLDDLVFCTQVHRPTVTVVGAADRGRGARSQNDAVPETDALVTMAPGVVLVVMVADCVPLVLCDPVAGILGCVHAGWRGTVAGVTPAAVRTMVEMGAVAERLVVGIGPAVGAAGYQVGPEVRAAAERTFGDRAGQVAPPDDQGRWRFDLVRANVMQLTDAGVPLAAIETSGSITGPGTRFFSDRATRPCGRFGVVARLRPEAG